MRHAVPVFCLFVLTAATAHAESWADRAETRTIRYNGDERLAPTVLIDEVEVEPLGQLSLLNRRIELHPKLLLGGGYASNPLGITDGGGSAALHYGGGLDIFSALTPTTLLQITDECRWVRFPAESGANLALYQVLGDVIHRAPGGRYRAGVMVEGLDGALADTGERSRRRISDGHADGTMRWRELSVQGMLRAERTFYVNDGLDFLAANRQHRIVEAGTGVGWQFGTRAQVRVGVHADATTYDNNLEFNNSHGGWVTVGGTLGLSTRTWIEADLGPAVRRYDDVFQGNAAYDDQRVTWLQCAAKLKWEWVADSQLSLVVDNGIEDAINANAYHALGVELSCDWAPVNSWEFLVRGRIDHSRNSGAPLGQEVDTRTFTAGGFDITYRLQRGVSFRWRNVDGSSVGTGSTFYQLESSVDMIVAF